MLSNFFFWLFGDLFYRFFGDFIQRNAIDMRLMNTKIDNMMSIIKGAPLDIRLMRHKLGSIDLSDVQEEQTMNSEERRMYCSSIAAIYPRIEKDIKHLMYKQIEWNVVQSENWDQTIFGRGTFNGFDLLLTKWKQATDEHLATLQSDKFDKHDPIGEV